jgi:hypothetical protein
MLLLTELELIRMTNYKDVALTALAKIAPVAATGEVTVSAAMITLSARAAWHFQIAFHHPML